MKVTRTKILEATENSEFWIRHLATRSDENLQRRIRINHLQYEIAYREKKEDVCELLNIMERILIEARIYKSEHDIPDTLSEIETMAAQVEVISVLGHERETAISRQDKPEIVRESQTGLSNDQLSLF